MSKEATKVQEGGVIDYTASGTISNGDVVPLTTMVGVALDDAVSGDTISLAIAGVFKIDAATADTVAVGDALYFDASNRVVTKTSTSNTPAGTAVTAKAGSTAGTVNVKIG